MNNDKAIKEGFPFLYYAQQNMVNVVNGYLNEFNKAIKEGIR